MDVQCTSDGAEELVELGLLCGRWGSDWVKMKGWVVWGLIDYGGWFVLRGFGLALGLGWRRHWNRDCT